LKGPLVVELQIMTTLRNASGGFVRAFVLLTISLIYCHQIFYDCH